VGNPKEKKASTQDVVVVLIEGSIDES